MWYCRYFRRRRSFWTGALVLAALAGTVPLVRAQPFPDPVEDLKQALQLPILDIKPGEADPREEAVRAKVGALKSLGDLQRALMLDKWGKNKSDVALRAQVGDRFTKRVKEALQEGPDLVRLSVVRMIGEMNALVESLDPEDKQGFTRTLAPQLIEVIQNKKVGEDVRAAAIVALGRVNPDPTLAAVVLKKILEVRSPQTVPLRLRAAQALRSIDQITSKPPSKNVVPTEEEQLKARIHTVDAAAVGLEDPAVAVRRVCAEVIQDGPLFLLEKAPVRPKGVEDFRPKEAQKILTAITPLLVGLADQGEVLARLVRDKEDPQVRVLALRALEGMSAVRAKILTLRRPGYLPLAPGTKNPPEEQLLKGVLPALKVLSAGGLANLDVPSQLAAIDFLELLEDVAAPAASALVQALGPKQDRFVRWAAARTVGRITPSKITPASTWNGVLQGLGTMVLDDDFNLRLASVKALQRYGPPAAAVAPKLIQAISVDNDELSGRNQVAPAHLPIKASASYGGSVEDLLEAVQALMKVGTTGPKETEAAVRALAGLLSNPEARVRRGGGEALERFGPAARSAIPALRAALNDEDGEVRLAASSALLSISPPKK
jgi:HEAT repeat protein